MWEYLMWNILHFKQPKLKKKMGTKLLYYYSHYLSRYY